MVSMTLPQYRRRECTINGAVVHMRPQWIELLAVLLVAGPNRYLPKDTLIGAIWPNPDFEPDFATAIVDRGIFCLRQYGINIETRYKFGVRIVPEAEAMREAA